MRLEQLRAFLVLAEELNFHRAAARLYLSQPALSAQVRDLERQLGTRLFERDRHGTRVTPEGARLVTYAEAVLAAVADLSDAAHNGVPRQRLRIGLGPGALGRATWATLESFSRMRPDLDVATVTLRFSDAVPALVGGRVDVLFAHGPLPRDHGVTVETVDTTRVAALVPRDDPIADLGPIDLDALVPLLRFVPPAAMGSAFRRFWLVEDHPLAGHPDEQLLTEDVAHMAQEAAHARAVGLWPSDVVVPAGSGAVLRPLAHALHAPLQVAGRSGPEYRDLLLASRHATDAVSATDDPADQEKRSATA